MAWANAPNRPPQILIPSVDSKFEKFRQLLELIEQERPGAKVLVFTYFVGTSRYLTERLTELGVRTERIAGDVPFNPKDPARDERGRAVRRFRDDPAIRVLISTEVGSEGLDFQFCHHLVNYDLPWNPMVVEQRIGRIDRYGQTADKIHIYNLVVEGTVEDRILHRLYSRIGLFEQSLGQIEDILGSHIAELRKEYVHGRLTPAEAEARCEEVARAADLRRVNIEELEQKASDLFGHEHYLKEQLRRIGRLGRYFAEHPLLALVEEYLHAQHPAVRIWQEQGEPFHRLRLTEELHRDIQRHHHGDGAWWSRSGHEMMVFTCDGEVAYGRDDVELLSTTHPLVRAASEAIRAQFDSPSSRVAKATLSVDKEDDTCPPVGEYLLVLYTNSVTGLRNREVIDVVAWPLSATEPLAADEGERLLHLLLNRGLEWQTTQPVPPIPAELWASLEEEARARNRRLDDAERRENGATYARRMEQLRSEYEHEQRSNRERLKKAELEGKTRILPAMRGLVAKAEARHTERMEALQKAILVTCSLSDPIAACVIRIV